MDGSVIQEMATAQEVLAVIAPWTKKLLAYLLHKQLPEDKADARWIIRQSKAYKVHKGEFYKLSTMRVLRGCIIEEEGRLLLQEIHTGMSGHHAAGRTFEQQGFPSWFLLANNKG